MNCNSKQGWTIGPSVPTAIRDYLESGAWRQDAVQVKQNRSRAVFRCAPQDSAVIFVKEDHATKLRDRAKNLIRCKAAQEFAVLTHMQNAGLPVVPPLGWARTPDGGLLATLAIQAKTLRQHVDDPTDTSWNKNPRWLGALASFLNRLLLAGLVHPDLHAGNILVDQRTGDIPTFTLVDLYGASLCSNPSLASRRRLFLWLVPILELLPLARRQALLNQIVNGLPTAGSLAAWPLLIHAWGRSRKARWPGLRNRLLGPSSICQRYQDDLGTWLVSTRSNQYLAIRQALLDYRAPAHLNLAWLKQDYKRKVARINHPDGSMVIKEYQAVSCKSWFHSPARRGWLNTAHATSISRRVAPCLAWIRSPTGSDFLIQKDVGCQSLLNFLPSQCPTADSRRPWLKAMADILAFLHLCGCFHADLKFSNWVSGPEGSLHIIDCDDVRFFARLPRFARQRNLRQLAETCPSNITRKEKLRFLCTYIAIVDLPVKERQKLLRSLRQYA